MGRKLGGGARFAALVIGQSAMLLACLGGLAQADAGTAKPLTSVDTRAATAPTMAVAATPAPAEELAAHALLPSAPKARQAWFRLLRLPPPNQQVEVCVVEVSRAAGRLHLLDSRRHGAPSRTYRDAAREAAGTLALINGGYFGFDDRLRYLPLGLLRIDGQGLSPASRWSSGGVVFWDRDEVRIAGGTDGLEAARAVPQALQSMPLLIEQGRVVLGAVKPTRAARSAVATTRDGGLLLVVAADARGSGPSLREFAAFLSGHVTRDGTRIEAALALDGGSSSHLYLPTLERHCGASSFYVPNVLALH